MAEAWALKRKVSANWTSVLGEMVAVTPWRTRSYDPATIWIVTGYFGVDGKVDFAFLLGASATVEVESPLVLRFRFTILVWCCRVAALVLKVERKVRGSGNFCRVVSNHVPYLLSTSLTFR
jgi:hypothetical protein